MSTTTSSGETNLQKLLATLKPSIHPDTYTFLTIPPATPAPVALLSSPSTVLIFRESEGITLITTQALLQQYNSTVPSDQQLEGSFPSRMITLTVHSSLDAVGFMAVIATRLAKEGMGVNPVSAFFHDHLFVPEARGDEAVTVLEQLAEEAGKEVES